MNPIGIVLALLFFWILVATGLVLVIKGAISLVPTEARIGLLAGMHDGNPPSLSQELLGKVTLALGLFLIYIGGNAIISVILR